MKKRVALFLCLAMILATGAFASASAFEGLGVVATAYGNVSGVTGPDYDVTIFKGIPYAAPPVGDLRWKAPQDAEPWEGTKVCDTYGNAAVQPAYVAGFAKSNPEYAPTWGGFYPDGFPENSEDCLYLNVFTPAVKGDENLPVFVWFHGGGLNHGYSYEAEFDAQGLADKGVVVVTVGTRLNIFGLLCLPQLSAETEYGGSGDYIVMDIAKSIQWVSENIAAFGGDPSRIHVGGQSGGSSKTTAALVSPLSNAYVAGTVNQSALGAFGSYRTLEQGYEAGLAALDALGLAHDVSVEELRALPAEDVIAVVDGGNFSGSTVIDGYALVESPKDFYLRAGQLDGVNMMAGNVFGESGDYEAATAADLYAAIREQFGDALCDKYALETALEVTDGNVGYYNRAVKSWYALYSARLYGEIMMKQNSGNFYSFHFGRIPPTNEWGWHSAELWYMFGSLRPGNYEREWEVWDYVTADAMTSYWSNFFANGDPNGYGVQEWKNGAEGAFMYLDAVSTCYESTPLDEIFREFYITANGLEAFF